MDDRFQSPKPDKIFQNERAPKRSDPQQRDPGHSYHFSNETIQSLRELGEVLREIHERLLSEGFIIRNGKITKEGANPNNHGDNGQHGKPNTQEHLIG